MAGAPPPDEGPPSFGSGSRALLRGPMFSGNSGAAKASGAAPPLTADTLVTRVFGSRNAANQRVSESLDYEPVQNKIFYERMRQAKKERHLFGYTGHTLAKFIITMVSGVLTGMFAVAMSSGVQTLTDWRLHTVQHLLDDAGAHRVWVAFLWNWAFSCVLVVFGVALVQYWAPQAAGAGVTLVMAYLNGNHVPNLLRMRTLITKLVGTICSVGAGFPMGPEGPMVHIGACLASVITYAQCTCLRTGRWLSCFGRRGKTHETQILERLKVLDDIVSDSDHREFISAGTAAGISAAFGAPIGGVLFAMEEACSFWSRRTSWRCFLAAVCATFTLSQLSSSAQHGMIAFTGVPTYENKDWLTQLPFILVNAGVAGLLGAAFNSMRMWLWRLRASKTRHLLRIGEVIGLALMCCSSAFFFPWVAGRCIPKNPEWGDEYGVRFMCAEGEHNDLATLFMSSSHHTIIKLFSMGHAPGQPYVTHFTQGSLALFVVVYLVLMSAGAGVAIPGGLFMPSIIVGAAWGGLWGSTLRAWLPHWNIQPGVYGIMAASSVLAGVFRSNVSLVVLVVEGTRGIEFMFGIILSVVIANWVAHHIHHDGVYESELERIGNLYFLRDEPPHRLHTLTAEMIMATGVVGFRPVESVASVLAALQGTTHNGFPIALSTAGDGGGTVGGTGGGGGSMPHGARGSFTSLGLAALAQAQASLAAAGAAGSEGRESPLSPRVLSAVQQGQALLSPPSPFAAATNGAAGAASSSPLLLPPTPPSPSQLQHQQQAALAALAGSGGLGGPTSSTSSTAPMTCEGGRLEGVILRSQLLVLLQRRHFCDQHGRPVGREYSEKQEIDLETEMRTFFRRYFTHNRYVSSTATPLEALQLGQGFGAGGGVGGVGGAGGTGGVDLGALFIDMRPYMNRSPFTVRRDCSASRLHEAFVALGMRHLVVVDAQNRIVGIVTRKDLDHAAGHGWWRMNAQAPKPNRRPPGGASRGGAAAKGLNNFFRNPLGSVILFNKLVQKEAAGQAHGTGRPGSSSSSAAAAGEGKAPYEVDSEEEEEEGGEGHHGAGDDGEEEEGHMEREPSGFFRAFRASPAAHGSPGQQHHHHHSRSPPPRSAITLTPPASGHGGGGATTPRGQASIQVAPPSAAAAGEPGQHEAGRALL